MNDPGSFFDHPLVISAWDFIVDHPVLWFVLLITFVGFFLAKWLAEFVPSLQILQSKILIPLSKRLKNKRLAKAASRNDIQGHVNRSINKIKKFLPSDWVKQITLQWVLHESKDKFVDDNQMVVLIRPVKNQEENFVKAVHRCLQASFFPKTKKAIPKSFTEAAVLHAVENIVAQRGKQAKKIFEDFILEPAIQKSKRIPEYLEDYRYMHGKGFFYGIFLRELHHVAHRVRLTSRRHSIGSEAKLIVNHIKKFIAAYETYNPSVGGQEEVWTNSGNVSQYAILLVANPTKIENGIDAYINRVRDRVNEGVERIYVFGTEKETKFCTLVIQGIQTLVTEANLEESFDTPFDYRGSPGGIGAVFTFDS